MQTFEPTEKWRYAYPGVFEGNLTGCTWAGGQTCRTPLKGEDCFEVRCGHLALDCPPRGQEVCPGFNNLACGKMPPPNEAKPYWMHKCNPLALPSPDKVTVLSCRPEADTGVFQCYFLQVRLGTLIISAAQALLTVVSSPRLIRQMDTGDSGGLRWVVPWRAGCLGNPRNPATAQRAEGRMFAGARRA